MALVTKRTADEARERLEWRMFQYGRDEARNDVRSEFLALSDLGAVELDLAFSEAEKKGRNESRAQRWLNDGGALIGVLSLIIGPQLLIAYAASVWATLGGALAGCALVLVLDYMRRQ